MSRLEDPVGVSGVGDGLAPPFDLDVAGCLFEEWWSGKAVHVEFGLWRHIVTLAMGWRVVGPCRNRSREVLLREVSSRI